MLKELKRIIAEEPSGKGKYPDGRISSGRTGYPNGKSGSDGAGYEGTEIRKSKIRT